MSYQSMGGGGHNYWTPRWFVRALEEERGVSFVVDMAACEQSRVCRYHLDGSEPRRDALQVDWGNSIRTHVYAYGPRMDGSHTRLWLWCNPPWANIGPFLSRCIETGGKACFCLPSRLEAQWGKLVKGYDIDIVTPRIGYWDPIGKPEFGLRPGIRDSNGIGTTLVWISEETRNGRWSRLDVSKYKPKGLRGATWPV